MSFSTADLYDAHEGKVQVAMPLFHSYGLKKKFYGEIVTVKCHEDNTPVGEMLRNENGKGKVLVVDGGGSLRCALLGDLIASAAVKNGWEGVIINGCIRDSALVNGMEIGVKALNTNPTKSHKRYPGIVNEPVNFANVGFEPGQYVYSDEDGVIVSEENLLQPSS
jgi:regulator of ribonuclease activity A